MVYVIFIAVRSRVALICRSPSIPKIRSKLPVWFSMKNFMSRENMLMWRYDVIGVFPWIVWTRIGGLTGFVLTFDTRWREM